MHDMEHEPIRVGQVREFGRAGQYAVTANDGYRAELVYVSGPWTGGRRNWLSPTIEDDPVVGWSREHLPPPVLTANPAEVVEGEVRVMSDDSVGEYAITAVTPGRHGIETDFGRDGRNSLSFLTTVTSDRLVSRPGVTL
jgi:hypothetical protein